MNLTKFSTKTVHDGLFRNNSYRVNLPNSFTGNINGMANVGNTCFASAAFCLIIELKWIKNLLRTRFSPTALIIDKLLKLSEKLSTSKGKNVTDQ